MTPLAPPMELLGAFSNATRGDNATDPNARPVRRLGRAVNIALFVGFLFASQYPYGAGIAALWALACGVGMWAGQQPGWGRYIGAITGEEKKELREVPVIDAMIAPLHPDNVAHPVLGKKAQIIMWGLAGGTLRGAWWGLCLAVFPLAFYIAGLTPWAPQTYSGAAWLLVTASTFGLVYGVVIHTFKHHPLYAANPIGKSWEAAELYFGALLWGAFAVAFLT